MKRVNYGAGGISNIPANGTFQLIDRFLIRAVPRDVLLLDAYGAIRSIKPFRDVVSVDPVTILSSLEKRNSTGVSLSRRRRQHFPHHEHATSSCRSRARINDGRTSRFTVARYRGGCSKCPTLFFFFDGEDYRFRWSTSCGHISDETVCV